MSLSVLLAGRSVDLRGLIVAVVGAFVARLSRWVSAGSTAPAPPLRLPLGAEAVERIGGSYTANLDALRRWADTARSADFPDAPPSSRPAAASWAGSA